MTGTLSTTPAVGTVPRGEVCTAESGCSPDVEERTDDAERRSITPGDKGSSSWGSRDPQESLSEPAGTSTSLWPSSSSILSDPDTWLPADEPGPRNPRKSAGPTSLPAMVGVGLEARGSTDTITGSEVDGVTVLAEKNCCVFTVGAANTDAGVGTGSLYRPCLPPAAD